MGSDGRALGLRRLTVAGVAAIALVATAVAVTRSSSPNPSASGSAPTRPSSPAGASTTGPAPQSRALTDALLMPRLRFAGLARGLPLSDPSAWPARDLSSDPVDGALVAVSHPSDHSRVLVLGKDHRWRRVDAGLRLCVDQHGATAPPLTARAISPDGRRVAFPQPGALVVVDVATGRHHSYPAGGPTNTLTVWKDATHVLVAEQTASRGDLVDLTTGAVTRAAYGPATAFTPEGVSLTWGHEGPVTSVPTPLRWSDGAVVPTLMNNLAGRTPLPALIGKGIVVGHNLPLSPAQGLDTGSAPAVGFVVLDRSTGNPLIYLPTLARPDDPTELLALHEDTVVFAGQRVVGEDRIVAGWGWRGRSIRPIARLPSGTAFAWGLGWPSDR